MAALLADVFHVFGQRKAVNFEQEHYFGLGQTGENPNYGSVLAYQPPMTVRVGLEADF